jgi:hypothetical protein
MLIYKQNQKSKYGRILMSLRAGQMTIKAKWKIDDMNIISANTFQCFFTTYTCFLYIGNIGPEKLIINVKQDPPQEITADVNTIGKYSLDIESFMRLKNEIDKTHKILSDQGIIKNE